MTAVTLPRPLAEDDDRSRFDCGRESLDPLPATLLGQLAVDKDYQGQRYAASLLVFALKTALHAADMVGSVGVITHPLDDSVRGFYAKWGLPTCLLIHAGR